MRNGQQSRANVSVSGFAVERPPRPPAVLRAATAEDALGFLAREPARLREGLTPSPAASCFGGFLPANGLFPFLLFPGCQLFSGKIARQECRTESCSATKVVITREDIPASDKIAGDHLAPAIQRA